MKTFLGIFLVVFALVSCANSSASIPKGNLTVHIEGLPSGVPANITVEGPRGYRQAITDTAIISSLTYGSYVVSAEITSVNRILYTPMPIVQEIQVESGATAEARVSFSPLPSRPDREPEPHDPDDNKNPDVNPDPSKPPGQPPAVPVGVHSIGYLPYWMHSSGMASIRKNHQMFTEISPFWYTPNPDGSITYFENGWYLRDKPAIVAELRDLGLKVTPSLVSLDRQLLNTILRTHRATHIQHIVDLVRSQDYDGIDIDYEFVANSDRDVFVAFIQDLATELHAHGKTLSVVSFAKTSDTSRWQAYDLVELGRHADQVRLMVYLEHHKNSRPGPIASLSLVNKALTYAASKMPKEKIIAGFGVFGIEWTGGQQGKEITYSTVMEILREHNATIQRNADGVPWFKYNDGSEKEVWFEDHRSIALKSKAVNRYEVGGVMFWHLGGEDDLIWQSLDFKDYVTRVSGGSTETRLYGY